MFSYIKLRFHKNSFHAIVIIKLNTGNDKFIVKYDFLLRFFFFIIIQILYIMLIMTL